MLKKVSDYVAKWHMLEQGDKVIVGVSGGADSVCLLFVLKELQKAIPFELIVVHVNHGLRGETADADEAYVKRLCEENHILCVTYLENVESIAKIRKQSTEEAGREVRREAFQKTMQVYGANKIATAHHKNDNVETFFMNLTRGTGLKGLGGIVPVTGPWIRPLLCLERAEIEAFLKERHILYCTDETNATDDYTRNRLRNHMIPFLESEVNSCAVAHINETMEQLREVQSFMEEQRDFYFQKCVTKKETEYWVSEKEFFQIPKVFQPLVLKEALVKTCGREKDISAVHVNALLNLFSKQAGKKLDLPYEVEAGRVYEGVRLSRKTTEQSAKIYADVELSERKELEISLGETHISFKVHENMETNGTFPQKCGTKYFDYDIMKRRLCVRTRQPGDYISIHPDGRKQKLKSYFINEKIPQNERDKILLVADGSHILWIVGYRVDCIYQAGRNTKHVLEIQINNKKFTTNE